ncbi:hypothetical protein Y880_01321 [Pseudomonas aeruginosa PAK]|nr:hypothetical protein Y880_01321 [Pseudomonas aeruginosa PAK]
MDAGKPLAQRRHVGPVGGRRAPVENPGGGQGSALPNTPSRAAVCTVRRLSARRAGRRCGSAPRHRGRRAPTGCPGFPADSRARRGRRRCGCPQNWAPLRYARRAPVSGRKAAGPGAGVRRWPRRIPAAVRSRPGSSRRDRSGRQSGAVRAWHNLMAMAAVWRPSGLAAMPVGPRILPFARRGVPLRRWLVSPRHAACPIVW